METLADETSFVDGSRQTVRFESADVEFAVDFLADLALSVLKMNDGVGRCWRKSIFGAR